MGKLILILVIILLQSKELIKAQDIIVTKHRYFIEGIIDTTTILTGKISYNDFQQNIKKSIDTSEVIFILSSYGKLLYPKYVVGNPKSHLAHWPNSNHYSLNDSTRYFNSIFQAKENKYSLCLACFNEDPFLPNDYLERSISYVSNIRLQSELEILSDHPKLSLLNKVLDTILKTWNTKLKGYKYRVLVYRGSPNALAVARGNIYISNELLDLLENDYELISVLVHEIAHIENRHSLRQYKNELKNKFLSFLISLISGSIIDISGYYYSSVSIMQTINLLSDFVLELKTAGFSRELEQEADITTQLYFESQNISKNYIISTLDKLAYYSLLRGIRIDATSIYSSHPLILNRIHQVNFFQSVVLKDSLSFSIKTQSQYGKSASIATIKIHSMSLVPSSDNLNDYELYLLGQFHNLSKSSSMKVENFFVSQGNNQIHFGGLLDIYFYKNESSEIAIKTSLSHSKAIELLNLFKQKSGFVANINLSYIRMKAISKEDNNNFTQIPNIVVDIE